MLFASSLTEPVKSAAEDRPFGIERRIPWTTSRLVGSPDPPSPYQVTRAFPKLTFDKPVTITSAPGTDRLFVMELGGRIFSFPNNPGSERADVFFDMPASVEGIKQAYGLTFHPQFEKNRFCYVCYVLAPNLPNGTRVSRFKVNESDPPRCDPKRETIIIEWLSGGHNGGSLKFGPDGCLYISTGDGAGPNPPDTLATGQDLSDLLSSILRIDVDHPEPGKNYRVPADNPFVNTPEARPEIWAYGLRNPWKMSFDRATGDLWCGDVGWELWELVFRIERGGNYGWSVVEGRQPVRTELKPGPTPVLPPVVDHPHTEARSVTGGFVYRGRRYPDLVGDYIYGDYVTGKIWGVRYDGKQVTRLRELTDSTLTIIDFAEDTAGELYVMDHAVGTIHQLVPRPAESVPQQFPRRLSETGLFSAVQELAPAPGVVPYSINAEPWADFTVAERYVALPGQTSIEVSKKPAEWTYPKDAVLVKTVSLDMKRGDPATRRRMETQVLHFNGEDWIGYSYVWNDEQTEATLADAAGADRTYTVVDADAPGGKRQVAWHVPSRAECAACHNPRAGSILGFIARQLNREHDYGKVADLQLRTLSHIGLLEKLPTGKTTAPFADPYNNSADVNERARAYLHVNCAHCHRRGGGGTAPFELQHELPLDKTFLVGLRPTQGTFDMHGAQVVAPGDPYRSILYYRLAKLGRGHMPQRGSDLIDERGLALIYDWITHLTRPTGGDESAATLRVEELAALSELRKADGSVASTQEPLVDRLLSSPTGALVLLRAIAENSLRPGRRDELIARAAAHPNPQVRDLFERFLPEEKRIKRLGSTVKPEQILSLRGDAERGKQLFTQAAGVQCRNCHRIQGTGTLLGPDLSGIGKKQARSQLLESLLEPSKNIDPKFVTYLVETKEGKVHSGLLVQKTAEEVVLTDAQNKPVRIPAVNVEVLVPQRQSLMPDLLVRDMTAQEVADLLEFLAAQRAAE